MKSIEHCEPGAKVDASQFNAAVPVSCSAPPVVQSGTSSPQRGYAARLPSVMNIELPR
ncbi:Uncharacterised protein [Mycobacteroides abscessus subsp. abscessus]|nr:Uncharacterised protein [Mycobacteroides abscessus subsp. abscessus]